MAADAANAPDNQPKAKIFISYSRKDMAFADRLEAALNVRGFEVLIDREEIYAFEDWWKRIEALIGRADTVVFVLSPDAVASEVALKEIAHAATLNKRFAPIVCRRTEDKAVPEVLRRLNFIFFDDPARFAAGADQLAEALNTDIGWVRQHTEFGEAARRWAAGGRKSGLLLRSPVLEEAERWIASRPRGAPEPTGETQAFVAESRRTATQEQQRRTAIISATGGMRVRSIPYYIPLVFILMAVTIAIFLINPFERLSLLAFDTYQRLSPREQTAWPVVIVDIDEASLHELGQWPWSRDKLAELVTRLTESGAIAIGFDMTFPEPDRMSPGALALSLHGLDDATRQKLLSLPNNDEIFADAIRHSRVVVGQFLSATPSKSNLEGGLVDNMPATGFAIFTTKDAPDPRRFFDSYHAILHSIPVIEQAAAGRGVINIAEEPDGIMRRVPVIMLVNDAFVPSLSLEMLRVGANLAVPLIFANQAGVQSVNFRGFKLLIDEKGRLWLHFSRSDPRRYVSAADVLQGRVPTDSIRGRMVLIGTTAAGLFDIKTTPIGLLPGVELNAQVLENILTNTLLNRPFWARPLELSMVITIGAALSFLMPYVSSLILVALSVLLLTAVAVGGWAEFKYHRLLIDPVYPIITLVTFITVLTFPIYRYSEAQRKKIRHVIDPSV